MFDQELIDHVLEQIVEDVNNKDLTAIEELLKIAVSDQQHLRSYLSELGA